MKPVGLLRIACFAAVAWIMALAGCSKFSERPAVAGFNAASGQLALLPAGYEAGETAFSADGRSVATAAKTAGKVAVAHNAKILGPYDSVRGLQFIEGGSELAFIAKKGDKEVVFANGVEGEPFDAVSALQYVANSPVVYTGQLAEKMQVVFGKKRSAPFDTAATTPIISFDGKQLAYVEYQAAARKNSLRACTSDLSGCRSGRQYDAISEFRSDATRSRFAFIAARKGKKTVVVVDFRQPDLNEKEVGWYDDVHSFNMSANGDHLAFLASRGDASLLVKDGMEIPITRFDTSFELNVAAGGEVIYGAMTGNKVRCFVDGKQVGKQYDSVDAPILSADGNHSLFATNEGNKYFIVVDGVAGPGFDMVVTPRFSPDGSRIVYRVRHKGERFVVVADLHGRTMREHPHYEAVWEVNFAPDGKTVGYGVKSGRQYRWHVEKI
jgi:subtilisin family serine protease